MAVDSFFSARGTQPRSPQGSNEAQARASRLPWLWGWGPPLRLSASFSGETRGCGVCCGGQAGTPSLKHQGDVSYNFFQQPPCRSPGCNVGSCF